MTEQEMEQLMQRLSAGREYRLMQSFSVRSNSGDDSGMIADGYATTFDQPYLLYDFGDYKVYEQIDSRAFEDCDMSDVIMQYDHRGRVFARTSNKTLELNPDNIGLYSGQICLVRPSAISCTKKSRVATRQKCRLDL